MKKRLKMIGLAAAVIALGAAANLTAFLITPERLLENAEQGAWMLGQEALASNELVGGFESAHLDNYTAVLMLKTAAYTGEEPLVQKAFGGLRVDMPPQDGQSDWEAFCTFVQGRDSPTGGGMGYGRYWHGYTLPLRLLLSVFNAANVQMILYAAQFGLILLTAYAMAKRGLARMIPAFALSWFLMMPAAMGLCFQYAPVSLVTLGACSLLLFYLEAWERKLGMPAFFLLTGMLTNYFDLLTFPLTSLTYPLILLIGLRTGEQRTPGKMAREVIACSIGWGLGYGGMWVTKWVLNALVLGPDALKQVTDQILLRLSTSSGGQAITRGEVVRLDLSVLTEKAGYLALLLAAAFCLSWKALRYARREKTGFNPRGFVLILPAVLPFLWSAVLPNHGFDHYYFVYRIFTGTIFAVFSALVLWTEKQK